MLAVLYAEVMQRLLARRAVAFAVRIDGHCLDECAAQLPTCMGVKTRFGALGEPQPETSECVCWRGEQWPPPQAH